MLGRALKMAFWVVYDHVGKLILANLVAVGILLVPLFLSVGALASGDIGTAVIVGLPALTGLVGVALPVVLAGLAHMTKELIETRDGSVRAMFAGMRLYGLRAAAMGLLYWLATVCLGTSVWFYGQFFQDSMPWLGYALSGVAAWLLLFVVLSSLYAVPALVQKRQGIAATMRLASLLVLDKPLLALGLAIQIAALSILLLLPPVAVLIYFAAVAAVTSATYEQLSRHYALREYERTGEMDRAALGHVAVISRDGRLELDDDQDDYLNRGLRDALFPWKE